MLMEGWAEAYSLYQDEKGRAGNIAITSKPMLAKMFSHKVRYLG